MDSLANPQLVVALGVYIILREVLGFLSKVVLNRKSDSADAMRSQVSEMHQWYSQIDPGTGQPLRMLSYQQLQTLITINQQILIQLQELNNKGHAGAFPVPGHTHRTPANGTPIGG